VDRPSSGKQRPPSGIAKWDPAFLAHEVFLPKVLRTRLPDADAMGEVPQEVGVALTSAMNAPLEVVQPWLCRAAIRQALLFCRRRGRQNDLHARYRAASGGQQGSAVDGDPQLSD